MIRCIHAARLSPEKQQLVIAESVIAAGKEVGGLMIDFFGAGAESIMTSLIALSVEFPNHIAYRGYDPDPFMHGPYQVAVMCSTYEGVPLFLLESINKRIVPVVTPCPGMIDVVEISGIGVVAKGFDRNAVTEALIRACRVSYTELEWERARRVIARKRMVDEFVEIYQGV